MVCFGLMTTCDKLKVKKSFFCPKPGNVIFHGSVPVLPLSPANRTYVLGLFRMMLSEFRSKHNISPINYIME